MSKSNILYVTNYTYHFLHFRYFMVTNNPRYGNCYSFNTVYKNEATRNMEPLQSSIAGPSFGLNIIVALDQRNYMKNGVTEQVRKYSYYVFFCVFH